MKIQPIQPYNIIEPIMFPFNNNQNQFPMQLGLNLGWSSPSPSPTPPTFMYSHQNLKPYESQIFLNQVFNQKTQLIQAFHTLTDQLKLKFYLSVEEMKLLGYMNDKQGYQAILQEIARRSVVLRKPVPVKNNKDQDDIWGTKLENLCDGHLKKLQQDTLESNHSNSYQLSNNQLQNYNNYLFNQDSTAKNQQQQFEWAQPGTQTENQGPKQVKTFDQIMEQLNPTKKKSKTESRTSSNKSFSNSNGKNNSMDLQMNGHQSNSNKKIQEQPVKMEHIDVWDLEVIQDQPENFKKKQSYKQGKLSESPVYQGNQSQSRINTYANSQLRDQEHERNYNQKQSYDWNKNDGISYESSSVAQTQNTQIFNYSHNTKNYTYSSSNHINTNTINDGFGFNSYNNDPVQLDGYNSSNIQANPTNFNANIVSEVKQSQQKEQDQFQEWTQAVQQPPQVPAQLPNTVPTPIPEPQVPISYNNINITQNNSGIGQVTQNNQADLFDSIFNPAPVVTSQPSQQQSTNPFQFDFLSSIPEYKPNISQAQPESPSHHSRPRSAKTKKSNQAQSQYVFQPQPYVFNPNSSFSVSNRQGNTGDQFNLGFNLQSGFGVDMPSIYTNQDKYQMALSQQFQQTSTVLQNPDTAPQPAFKKKPEQPELELSRPAINLTQKIIALDLKILQPFKIAPKTHTIELALKKKIFDFDREFYQEALNLIEELGYVNNPDYASLKEQEYICGEIFRLTQLYSAAVDQQQQQQIMLNFKKCKGLYSKLDTDKTANIAKKYLKMSGQTLAYQIGKLALEAGVPKQLIEKAIRDEKFTTIATLLYLMQYFGSTFSISLFAAQVIEYIESVHAQMLQFTQMLEQSSKQSKILFKKSPKFTQYKQNLTILSHLANRILYLTNHCSKDQQFINKQQINTKLNTIAMSPQIRSPYDKQQPIPAYFLAFFADFASCKENNIYTLHERMSQFIERNPLCCVCLYPVRVDGDGVMDGTQGNGNGNGDRGGYFAGGKRDDRKFYHFMCWNFKCKVNEYKTKQMQMQMQRQAEAEQQFQGYQQQDQQKIEQVHNRQNNVQNKTQTEEQDEWVESS